MIDQTIAKNLAQKYIDQALDGALAKVHVMEVHGKNPDAAPEELMSVTIEGNNLVIRLPLDLMIWAERMREESIYVIDKTKMGEWLVENILEYGGDSETGSTAIEDFLDAAFLEALESAEPWLQGWWELEEDDESD